MLHLAGRALAAGRPLGSWKIYFTPTRPTWPPPSPERLQAGAKGHTSKRARSAGSEPPAAPATPEQQQPKIMDISSGSPHFLRAASPAGWLPQVASFQLAAHSLASDCANMHEGLPAAICRSVGLQSVCSCLAGDCSLPVARPRLHFWAASPTDESNCGASRKQQSLEVEAVSGSRSSSLGLQLTTNRGRRAAADELGTLVGRPAAFSFNWRPLFGGRHLEGPSSSFCVCVRVCFCFCVKCAS